MVGFQGRSPVEKLEVDGIVGGRGVYLKANYTRYRCTSVSEHFTKRFYRVNRIGFRTIMGLSGWSLGSRVM